MTTRRTMLMMAGGATLLSACREPAADPAAPPLPATVPDQLLVERGNGLARLAGDRLDDLGDGAVPGMGAAEVYTAATGADVTTVHSTDPASGRRTGRGAVAGRWFVRSVSANGQACVLAETPPEPSGGAPAARSRTGLTILGAGTQRRLDLAGVVEPDAFTTDGTGLFVLQWLPPNAPDRYRVRLLEPATGTLGPLLTRAKTPVPPGAEEEMRGAGRQAVLSPDRNVLYTLYTHQGQHRHTRDLIAGRPGGVHAFVHVLHLDQRWAYCLDLPHPFGAGPAAGHTLTLDPTGRTLFVADLTSGSLARADTQDLTVRGVTAVPAATGTAAAAVAPDGRRVFVGASYLLTVVDAATGALTGGWKANQPIRGLGVSRDGKRVYIGSAGAVSWLDATTGVLLGRAAAPGLTALREVRGSA